MRQKLKSSFLQRAGLGDYKLISLPVDASFRSYDRVKTKDTSFILMDAPPEKESTEAFVDIARLLSSHNFKSPEIFQIDSENGFLLLEDFGHVRIKDRLIEQPEAQEKIYKNIINLLSDMQKKVKADHLKKQDLDLLLKGIETYVDWYFAFEEQKLSAADKALYLAKWQKLLAVLPDLGQVIVLRDFHVENLMHISENEIGILDFQDAVVGHPAYDLVSVLQDARHEVSEELEKKMIDLYLQLNPHFDKEQFLFSYNILGAQRNSRILGVFARKFLRDGQDKYLEFMPRVQNYLDRNFRLLA